MINASLLAWVVCIRESLPCLDQSEQGQSEQDQSGSLAISNTVPSFLEPLPPQMVTTTTEHAHKPLRHV